MFCCLNLEVTEPNTYGFLGGGLEPEELHFLKTQGCAQLRKKALLRAALREAAEEGGAGSPTMEPVVLPALVPCSSKEESKLADMGRTHTHMRFNDLLFLFEGCCSLVFDILLLVCYNSDNYGIACGVSDEHQVAGHHRTSTQSFGEGREGGEPSGLSGLTRLLWGSSIGTSSKEGTYIDVLNWPTRPCRMVHVAKVVAKEEVVPSKPIKYQSKSQTKNAHLPSSLLQLLSQSELPPMVTFKGAGVSKNGVSWRAVIHSQNVRKSIKTPY